jgi:VanZ family protein
LFSELKGYSEIKKDISLRSAVFYWLLTIGYMGIIFYLSSLHNIPLPKLPRDFDKVLHLCAYIPLAYLFYLSLKKSGINKYVFVLAVIFASIYGITDELHQVVVPGRDASVGDLLADAIGAFLGSLAARIIKT